VADVVVQNIELVVRVGRDTFEKRSELGKRLYGRGQDLESDGFKVLKNKGYEVIKMSIKGN